MSQSNVYSKNKSQVNVSAFEVLKNWGSFWPSGVSIGGNFQILEFISYITYIVVTSDVNKSLTFLGVILRSQVLINAENSIFQSNFQRWASVSLQSILTGNFSRKYTIQCFSGSIESGWFLCF